MANTTATTVAIRNRFGNALKHVLVKLSPCKKANGAVEVYFTFMGSKVPRIVISALRVDKREYPASRSCRCIPRKGSPLPTVEFG
jgi:hypothetical protein